MTRGKAAVTALVVSLVVGGIGALLTHQPIDLVCVLPASMTLSILNHANYPTVKSLVLSIVFPALVLLGTLYWTTSGR